MSSHVRWTEQEMRIVATEFLRRFGDRIPTQGLIFQAQNAVLSLARHKRVFTGDLLDAFRAEVVRVRENRGEYESTALLIRNGEPLAPHNGFVHQAETLALPPCLPAPDPKMDLPPAQPPVPFLAAAAPAPRHVIPSCPELLNKLAAIHNLALELQRLEIGELRRSLGEGISRQRCLNLLIQASNSIYYLEEVLRHL